MQTGGDSAAGRVISHEQTSLHQLPAMQNWEPEGSDQLGKLERLAAHLAGLALGLLGEARVLDGECFHLCHGLIDLADSDALLLAGRGNVAHESGDALDCSDDIRDRPAGIVNELASGFDTGDGIADQGRDFLCGLR